MSITRPGEIGEGGVVQITDNAQRPLLLCIVDMYCILRGDCVDYPVWETESWWRSSCWWCECHGHWLCIG